MIQKYHLFLFWYAMPGPSLPLSTQRRALVDCDGFFAGCEVAKRPELRGKCVYFYGEDLWRN